jgi:PTH2 family peptidyl-tRNA hydrolase
VYEVRTSNTTQEEAAVSDDEKRLVVRVNSNLNWSRGKMAAHAVHAALRPYGIEYDHPVIVLGAKPPEILDQEVHIRDLGRTELEPGTLTAGASWEFRAVEDAP